MKETELLFDLLKKGVSPVQAVLSLIHIYPKMLEMLGGFTVIRMINLMGAAGPKVEWKKEDLLGLNAQLNKIKRVD